MSDRLNQHAGHHALRDPLHQFQSEAIADALEGDPVVKVHVLEVNALACFQRSILARDS